MQSALSLTLKIVELGVERRVALSGPSLELGAGASETLGSRPAGTLRIQREPLRVEHRGGGELPRVRGRPERRFALVAGEEFEWCGARLTLELQGAALLEELPPPPDEGPASEDLGGWLLAGVRVEQGLAAPEVAERWQAAVRAGAFDAQAAAQEIGAALPEERPRLQQRCANLMRDLVMAPVGQRQQSPKRRVRRAASGLAAFLLAQVLGLLVYSLLVLLALFFAHAQGVSLDGLAERALDSLR